MQLKDDCTCVTFCEEGILGSTMQILEDQSPGVHQLAGSPIPIIVKQSATFLFTVSNVLNAICR